MELFVPFGMGVLIVALGLFMAVTGNGWQLLHGYHYANVPPSERPALARENGVGLVLVGAGICAFVASAWMAAAAWAAAVGGACLAAGVVVMLASIVRRNGGLIASAPVVPGTRAARFAPFALGALGLLLGLTAVVPGAHMLMTGDVSALHSYHYAGVAAADIPRLAFWVGLGEIGLGLCVPLGMFAGGGMAIRPMPLWSKILMGATAVLFCASLLAMVLPIPYYGGSLAG